MNKIINRSLFCMVILFAVSLFVCLLSLNVGYADENQNFETPSNLDIPDVSLALNGVTLEQINAGSKDTKYPGNELQTNDGVEKLTYQDVEIKGRGNTTWLQPKKPYQIKLSKSASLFGLGKSKKWVLLANFLDPSNLRNDTAFTVASYIGMKYTWAGKSVNLWVDGKYIGLYWLTHKPEIGDSTVSIGKEGILVESDFHTPDDIYFRSVLENRMFVLSDSKKESEEEIAEDFNSFEAQYNNLEDAMYRGDWHDVCKYCDADSLAEYVLLADFTFNPDAFKGSFYFYRNNNDDVIHCGPPWDFDDAFFRRNFENPEYWNCWSRTHSYDNWWSSKLMDIKEFRDLVTQKYKEKLRPNMNNIISRIEYLYNDIYDSAINNNIYWGLEDYSHAVNYLKDSINTRFEYLDLLYGLNVDVSDGYYDLKFDAYSDSNTYYIQKLENGCYRIVQPTTNNVLTVTGSMYDANPSVGFSRWCDINSQHWILSERDGHMYFVSKETGMVLSSLGAWHLSWFVDSAYLRCSLKKSSIVTPDVKVENVGDGCATLIWGRIDNAEKYAIAEYINGSYLTYTYDCLETKYTFDNLANGYTHEFLVQAYINGKWSTFSLGNHVFATPQGHTKPYEVKATGGNFRVELSWRHVPGATKYAIATLNNDGSFKTYTLDCINTSYVINNLNEFFEYNCLVQAFIMGKWSSFDYTDLVSVKTAYCRPKVNIDYTGDGSAMLSWNSIESATDYAIAEAYDDGSFRTFTYNCKDIKYLINDLANGYGHNLLVQAKVNGIWSNFDSSNYVFTKTQGKQKPVDVFATPGNYSITLSWLPVPGASNYAVAIKNIDGTYTTYTYNCKQPTDVTKPIEFVIYPLNPMTLYRCLVQCNVFGRWSSFTDLDLVEATTLDPRPKPVASVSDNNVVLNWSVIPGAAKYAIAEVVNGAYFTYTYDCISNEFIVKNLKPGKHTFLVQSCIDGKWSPFASDDFVSVVII